MKVNIRKDIEYVGKRKGIPIVRVELGSTNYYELDVNSIYRAIVVYHIPDITICGNVDLASDELTELLIVLTRAYKVNVEVMDFKDIQFHHKNLFYTIHFPTNTLGGPSDFYYPGLDELTSEDVLFFGIGTIQDVIQSNVILQAYEPKALVYYKPLHDYISDDAVKNYLLSLDYYAWVLQ